MCTKGEANLKFVTFSMRQTCPTTPSITKLKKINLPGFVEPQKVASQNAIMHLHVALNSVLVQRVYPFI